MIHIFTLMTSVYNNFLHRQLETVKYLFPGHKKTFNLISDKMPQGYEDIKIDEFESFNFLKIIDFPYPLVTLCKTIYMVEALNKDVKDYEAFVFVDADTIFLDKGKDFYDRLLKDIENHDLIFTLSPWQYKNFNNVILDYEYPWKEYKYGYAEYMNDDETEYASHYALDEKTVYVQTSFFAGRIKSLKELNKDIRKLMTPDLNHKNDFLHPNREQQLIRHIPLASEENYCNKIINDCIHSDNPKYNLLLDCYHYNGYYPFTNNKERIKSNFPNIFLKQKYDMVTKGKKRNGDL